MKICEIRLNSYLYEKKRRSIQLRCRNLYGQSSKRLNSASLRIRYVYYVIDMLNRMIIARPIYRCCFKYFSIIQLDISNGIARILFIDVSTFTFLSNSILQK